MAVDLSPIDESLLATIANLHGMPKGAFNIRRDGKLVERHSSAYIDIVTQTGRPGIEIHVKPGTKGETVFIPVIITQSGVKDVVYNDFFIGENCDIEVRDGGLIVVGEQALGNDELGAFCQFGFRVARRGRDAANLNHVHIAVRILVHVHDGLGVQDALSRAFAFAIVLLDVLDAAVLADVERMDAVVLAGCMAVVVDAATRDDLDVAIIADVERVVHDVLEARLRDDDRDEHRLALRAGLDFDVDTRIVGLGLDFDVGRAVTLDQFAVAADVERTFRHAVNIRDGRQQALIDWGKIYCHS